MPVSSLASTSRSREAHVGRACAQMGEVVLRAFAGDQLHLDALARQRLRIALAEAGVGTAGRAGGQLHLARRLRIQPPVGRYQQASAEQQQRIARARSLLSVASDTAATQHEREQAYDLAGKELDGLVVLPPTTRAGIERGIAGQLDG
jgi:hypothetical protein